MNRALPLVFAAALAAPASVLAQHTQAELLAAGRAAAAGGDPAGAYRLFRQAYDPPADDLRVLAAMAGAAASAGDLPRFRALLDSVVGPGAGYRHALEYWAALALDGGTPVGAAVAELEAYLAARPDDAEAHASFTTVLVAHGEGAEAVGLLERAAARGAPPEAVALSLGAARRGLGDAEGAVEAWARALALGDERASDRIRQLLDAWPSGSTPAAAIGPLSRARDRAEPWARAELTTLLAEARAVAGDGEGALETARGLEPGSRLAALRAVAERARVVGDLATARRAVEELIALGPADPADRGLLAEIERVGDPARRAEAGPAPVADPRLAMGDRALARARPDSAIAAYASVVGPEAGGGGEPAAIEALGRIRLVRALVDGGIPASVLATLGETLLSASGDPARAGARLDSLAGALAIPDSAPGAALLAGLAGEWRGRGGDPAGASAALEGAAELAGVEAPALLLAAGRWAAAGDEPERARGLWRRVVERFAETPYALEARRLLAEPWGGGR